MILTGTYIMKGRAVSVEQRQEMISSGADQTTNNVCACLGSGVDSEFAAVVTNCTEAMLAIKLCAHEECESESRHAGL